MRRSFTQIPVQVSINTDRRIVRLYPRKKFFDLCYCRWYNGTRTLVEPAVLTCGRPLGRGECRSRCPIGYAVLRTCLPTYPPTFLPSYLWSSSTPCGYSLRASQCNTGTYTQRLIDSERERERKLTTRNSFFLSVCKKNFSKITSQTQTCPSPIDSLHIRLSHMIIIRYRSAH